MSAPAIERTEITEPGVYDLPEDIYHADPVPSGSLSHSGAKAILPPNTPAQFRWQQDHPVHKDVFDFGHAAHKVVLGDDLAADVIVCDYPDWRTKKAQDEKKAAYEAGKTPILAAEAKVIDEMAAALRRHPTAAALLDADSGAIEQSAFWFDEEFGIWRRARFDKLARLATGQLAVVDYKSATTADPKAWVRKAVDFGYHQQDPWYTDGAEALGLGEDVLFFFVVQDKNPPYLVSVVDFDAEARQVGRERNRRAMEIYADCAKSGVWPGHSLEVERVSLPKWAIYQHEELTND